MWLLLPPIRLPIKKRKGLAIRGTGSVKVADPKKVLELSNYMMGNLIGGNNNHNVPAQPQSLSLIHI